MLTCTRTVLLGAEKKELDVHSNYQRTNELRADLLTLGLSFVGVSNVSAKKKSQLFAVENVPSVEVLKILASKYEQRAILTLDENKNMEVVSTRSTGSRKLGKLAPVTRAETEGRNFYLTFVEEGKEYFYTITKKGIICEK